MYIPYSAFLVIDGSKIQSQGTSAKFPCPHAELTKYFLDHFLFSLKV